MVYKSRIINCLFVEYTITFFLGLYTNLLMNMKKCIGLVGDIELPYLDRFLRIPTCHCMQHNLLKN